MAQSPVNLRKLQIFAAIALSCFHLCVSAFAQDVDSLPPSVKTEGAITVNSLQTEIKLLETNQDLEESIRKKAVELLQKTIKELEEAARFTAELQALERSVQESPSEMLGIQQQLETPLRDISEPSMQTPLDTLQQALTESQGFAVAAAQEFTALETEINRRAQRRTIVPTRLNEARDELEDLQKRIQVAASVDEPQAVTNATAKYLNARRQTLLREIQLLEREIPAYDATARVLNAKRDLAAKQVAQTRRAIVQWQEVINVRRQFEAREHAREANALIEKVDPAVRPLANEVAEIAEQLVPIRAAFSQKIVDTAASIEDVDRSVARFKARFEELLDRAEKIGFTNAVGLMLRQHRTDLPNPKSIRDVLNKRQIELSKVHMQRIEFRNQRIPGAELEAILDETTKELVKNREDDRERISRDVRAVIQSRRRYLSAAIQDSEKVLDQLSILDTKQRILLEQIDEQESFIAEHILWVKSAPRFGIADLSKVSSDLKWVAVGFVTAGEELLVDARSNSSLYGFCFLVFFILLFMQSKLRSRLSAAGILAAKRNAVLMAPTWNACGLTLLIATFWPLSLAFIGWRLGESPNISFSDYAGRAFLVTAVLLLTIDVFRHICRPNGLGRSHFDWPERSTSIAWKALRLFRIFALPLIFFAAIYVQNDFESYVNSTGRLSMIGALLGLAMFAHHMLRPSGNVIQEVIGKETDGWIARTRYVWYPLAVGMPLLLAAAAFAGYNYTARQLTWLLIATIWLTIVVLFVDALLKRWLVLTYRSLAMKKARERRLAMQQAAEPSTTETPVDTALPEFEESEVSLAVSNAQVRRLMRIVFVFVSMAGVWLIWSEVLPAFGVLRQVELWPSTIPGADMLGLQGVNTLRWITLAEVTISLIVGIVTFVASRNLPGLLEFTILQRLPIDGGTRYAVTTVCRYIITVVGVAVIFRILGFSWESVQWLVAAMTVGLGFGLQEIFANFVSGLIILFERPIRVGDTVTVGEITGTVTRIRIRATTISDWDRKELIIPNREFVTGQLINWSLSDPVIRAIIRVGIAYGSDVRLAKKLLLQIAHEHPHILNEPEPNVMFWEFGESSLNFELRVFVSSVQLFRVIPDEVNTRIDDLFREHGIEIAFPQRDLHIRSVDSAISVERRIGSGSV